MALTEITWPQNVAPRSRDRGKVGYYPTPEGNMHRVSSILKVLGFGTDALMNWAADQEREATLISAGDCYELGLPPEQFIEEIEKRLGKAKAHLKSSQKAKDLGTEAHDRIRWMLAQELGLSIPKPPTFHEETELAVMAFDDWRKASGFKPVAMNQVIWDPGFGYAGEFDVYGYLGTSPGILDFKTSKWVYDTHHLQVAAYMNATRRWAPVDWGTIIRLPKSLDDRMFQPKGKLDVVNVGELYDRTLSEQEIFAGFVYALEIYKRFIFKEEDK